MAESGRVGRRQPAEDTHGLVRNRHCLLVLSDEAESVAEVDQRSGKIGLERGRVICGQVAVDVDSPIGGHQGLGTPSGVAESVAELVVKLGAFGLLGRVVEPMLG